MQNLTCTTCTKQFKGIEGKEDTCPECLKPLIQSEKIIVLCKFCEKFPKTETSDICENCSADIPW